MNPPLHSIRAQPLLPQGLLWLMFVFSCIRATGWKLLSFPAVLYHIVNWLTGSDGAARIKQRQPKWALFFTSLPFPLPLWALCFHSIVSEEGLQRPLGACACESVTHVHAHTLTHTHSLTLLPSGAKVMNCAFESLLIAVAHMCWDVCACVSVGGMQWEARNGKNRAPCPCPLCLDEISDAAGCLVSKSFAK